MNKYRFKTKEEMKQAWKEHLAVAPTIRSYNIGDWLLYSGFLVAIVMVLGLLFKIHIALGAITMGTIIVAPIANFFYKRSKKRWKK